MSSSAEPKPHFKIVGKRVDPNGISQRFSTIDNHRSNDFGGFRHDPLWMSCDAMLSYLERRILDDKGQKSPALPVYKGLISGNHNGFKEAFFKIFSGAVLNSYKLEVNPAFQINPNQSGSLTRVAQKSFSPISQSSELDPRLSDLLDRLSQSYCTDEEAFRRGSRWRSLLGANNTDDAWEEFQETLKPSLAEEDVLGGFEDWLENFPPDHQYLMIGDTNHYNRNIRAWLEEGATIPALAHKGFKDIVLEMPIEIASALHAHHFRYESDQHLQELSKRNILSFCDTARKHGIRVHAFDRQIHNKPTSETYAQRHRHDEELAYDIRRTTKDRQTVVIYGAAHFSHNNGLYDLLGRQRSRVINVHEDLEDYRDPKFSMNARFPADYVFLIDSGTVIASRGVYSRQNIIQEDHYLLNSVIPAEQERECEKFRIRFTMAREKNPEKYGAYDPEEIIRSAMAEWKSNSQSLPTSHPVTTKKDL